MQSRNFKRSSSENNIRLNGSPVSDLLATKIVWAHHIGYGLPDYDREPSTNKLFYGDSAPLELHATNHTPRPQHGVARMLASGINGLQVDIINGTWSTAKPFVMIDDYISDADATHTNPNPNQRFYLAPCIDAQGFSEANLRSFIQSYVASATTTPHPSYAKVNGKYVIYFYGAATINNNSYLPDYSSSAITASTTIWNNIRTWINANDIPVYLVRDIAFNTAYNAYQFTERSITPWNRYFDASYAFDILTLGFWRQAAPYINLHQLTYFGGLQPGYNRESMWGGYVDPNGTALLRSELSLMKTARPVWQNVVTWGDFVENTEVRPTTNWNCTRADIVNFYSAQFRGVVPIRANPALYITTRMFITVGDPFLAEAMVINPGTALVSISVQLYAADRTTALGSNPRTLVRGGTTGDATTAKTLTASSSDIGKTFYAKAASYDAANNLLETVWSAPIIVYAPFQPTSGGGTGSPDVSWQTNNWPYDEIRTGFDKTLTRYRYYSIPAYAALENRPTLTINGNPAAINDPINTPDTSKATAIVTAPTGVAVRSIELLQNTQLVARTLSTEVTKPTSLTAAIPVGNTSNFQIQAAHNVNPKGFYVARIITEDEKVSYSEPLYFS